MHERVVWGTNLTHKTGKFVLVSVLRSIFIVPEFSLKRPHLFR